MLKNTIAAALIIVSITSSAQEEQTSATQEEVTQENATKMEYAEVVTVEGATKDQLFRIARKWFQKNYSEKTVGESVIYTDDSYLGEMAASPNMWVVAHSFGKNTEAGAVNYTIVIAAKEGKYKYTISGFYHESNRSRFGSGGDLNNANPDCGEEEMSAIAWTEIKADCKMKTDKLVAELKEVMAAAASSTEDDW